MVARCRREAPQRLAHCHPPELSEEWATETDLFFRPFRAGLDNAAAPGSAALRAAPGCVLLPLRGECTSQT